MSSASGQALMLLRGFHPGPSTPAAKAFWDGIVLQPWSSAQNRGGCVSPLHPIAVQGLGTPCPGWPVAGDGVCASLDICGMWSVSLDFGELQAEEPGPCTLCFPR